MAPLRNNARHRPAVHFGTCVVWSSETVITCDAQQLQRKAVNTVGRRDMFTSTLQAAFSQQARGAEATAAPVVTSNFRDGGCGVASRQGAVDAEVGNAWRTLRLVGCALWYADST
jgi:hypothetical protein